MGVAEMLGAGAARLLFYPTLLYTAVRAQLPGSKRPWFHRIDSTVLLGALPLRGRSRRLVVEQNVRAVVTLNEEYETRFLCCSVQEWEAMGVEQLRLSTVDLTGVPTLENLHKGVEFILQHRAHGNSVYVHCKAGRSRSATMVAAYLIQAHVCFMVLNNSASIKSSYGGTDRHRSNQTLVKLHRWSPQEAVEAIAKIRPHILIRHKQVQVLETFHRNVIAGTTAQCQ